MREKIKNYVKYFLGIAIITYALLLMLRGDATFLDNLDLSVTITLGMAVIYSEWFWKYNPFEKTPKIYGEYKMTFISTYNNSKRMMNVTIKQNLFSARIYMDTDESESESTSSNIIIKNDSCELIYTYLNKPKAIERNHSGIHFGTCMFKIIDNVIKSGQYYTDRKTTGDIKNIKKIK